MKGIAFLGKAKLSIQGSGDLNAREVQFWVDSVETQGAARIVLKADPDNSISEPAVQSVLIR